MGQSDGVGSMGKHARLRRAVLWGGGAVGASAMGGLFLWFALRRLDWGAVNHAMASASVPHLLAGLGLVIAGFVVRGFRWRLLLHDRRASTLRLILVENTAVGVNSLTPIPILDEPTRLGLLAMKGVPVGTILATMAAMRTFELASQSVIGMVGLMYLPPLRALAPYILAAATVSVVAMVALFTIGPILRLMPALRRLPLARDFSSGVAVMRKSPWRTMAALGLSGAYAIIVGIGGWMIALGLDIELGILALVILSLAVIFFTDWIPGLPGAVGTFEFVGVYLLGLWNVDRSTAFGYAILLHAVFFIPPLLIAAAYLPYAGFRSVGAVMRLVRSQAKADGPGEPDAAAPVATKNAVEIRPAEREGV